MKEHCTETNTNRLVVFKENKSKLTIENTRQLLATKIKVDGCQITEGLRCDFLYILDNQEFFIELKGQDLSQAIRQLEETIRQLSLDEKKQVKTSFIICTRSPLSSAKIQNLQVRFKKYYNSDLIVKSSPHSHKVP